MTAQEVFDKVGAHLMAQGQKSLAEHSGGTVDRPCLYRGSDGLMCAAGCLITNDEYRPEMEQKTIGQVIDEYNLRRLSPHIKILLNLQWIHDHRPHSFWNIDLVDLAGQYSLDSSNLPQINEVPKDVQAV